MALETPNAIVASAVVLFDALAPSDRLEVRSSTGLKQGVQELINQAGFAPYTFGVFDLEQPLSNDEAVILPSDAGGPPKVACVGGWVTPSNTLSGAADLDALASNKLVMFFGALGNFNPAKGRVSFSVVRLITTALPIPGEPVP